MNIRILIISAILVMYPCFMKAQDRPDTITTRNTRPLYVNFQYAGNVGIASVGAGTAFFHQKMYIGFIYGYLPESVNDAVVHTIAIKTYYKFLPRNLSKKVSTFGYIGTNINYGITKNTYLKYPDYFPDDYYNTNAIHIAPFIGGKIDFSKSNSLLEKIGIYCELGTIDKYVADMVISKQVSVFDIFSLGTGISFTF